MTEIDDPHFAFPFSLASGGGQLAVAEQDSDREIEDCVEVLLTTVRGERIDEPDYGIEDPTFLENGADLDAYASAIERWERRLPYDVERAVPMRDMTDRIRVRIQGRGLDG